MSRPLRKSLSDEAIELMNQQRADGLIPAPVHLMLVEEIDGQEMGQVACRDVAGSWGEWVTGAVDQVTCHPCLEQVHA